MDEPAPSFEELLARAREGDNGALGQLFTLYSDPVRRVVRKMLHRRLRRGYDSVDFVQSVWASFIDLSAAAYDFATPEEMVAFLSRIAYNKVVDTTRRKFHTRKHDLGRETSLDLPQPGQPDPLANYLPARVPTPSQYVIADECWQRIVAGLPPAHCRVLELLRDDHSQVEISRALGVDVRLIQRLLNRLRYYLDRE